MRNIWLVMKHAIGTTLSRRSFWLLTFVMPVLLLAIQSYYVIQDNGLGSADSGDDADKTQEETSAPAEMLKVGLVDETGLIAEIPPSIPSGLFVRFPDEATARAALEADQIAQVVHIPSDYIATGEVTVYDKNFQILRDGADMGVAFHSINEWVLGHLINVNLTGDERLVSTLGNPIPAALAERHILNPPVESGANDQALAELVANVIPYIYYFLLLIGSSYLMRSVVAEKENRTAEVLLVSLRPRELMAGKMLGMTMVTLVELAVWLGGGMLILDRGSDWLNVSDYTFPSGFVLWAVLFLLLGFLLYASIMAAAGALANNSREGGQMMWLLLVPLLPTLMFGSIFVENPDSSFALILSMFPLSAPSAMVTRLAVADVPAWQLIASLLGLGVSTYLIVVLAGRFFRSDNLLSQAAFNWRRMATGWREQSL